MINYLPIRRSQWFIFIRNADLNRFAHKHLTQHCMQLRRGTPVRGLRLRPVGIVGTLGLKKRQRPDPGGRSEPLGVLQEMGHG